MALIDNLLSYYNLQTNSNDNFWTRNGTDVWTTYSSWVVLDATTDKVWFADSVLWTWDFTISFFVNPSSFGSNLAYYSMSWWTSFIIYQPSFDPTKIRVNHNNGTDLFYDTTSWLSTSTWAMVTVTRSWDTMTTYINWVSSGTGSGYSGRSMSWSTTEQIWFWILFAWAWTYKYLWIWKRALSWSEITQLYNSWSWLSYPFWWVTTNPAFFLNLL